MNPSDVSHPAAPLLAFSEALGLPQNVWGDREELEQLTYDAPEFSREKAVSLTLDQIIPLLNAYGDALTCRFLIGDLPALAITPGLDEAMLAQFKDRTRGNPTLTLEFSLNKRQLLDHWQGIAPHCRLFLYLFPAALEHFLTRRLGQLEADLWDSSPARKVILVVPDREIWLDGQYLAVLGGGQLGNWHAVVPQRAPDKDRPLAMYQICRETLKWQESWLQHLTPLHLRVNGRALPDDRIANALRVHLANVIILYTADRTVIRTDEQWLATYAGATQRVELLLGTPQDRLDEEASAGVSTLLRIVEWAYDAQWADNRLPLVQIGMAQALSAVEPTVRYRQLLRNAGNIFDGLQWNWKAFIEGKVDAYMTQLRALEDYVASTVQAFVDQISTMIKSLSDTMLAAVGALLASFIAALFKDKFNATIFSIGMLVYALYVLVFPLGYNMLHQWQRYRVLVNDFDVRRRRFEERLYPEKVSEIVGTQINDNQRRFRRWFVATFVSYITVIILAGLAAVCLPRVLANTILLSTPVLGP